MSGWLKEYGPWCLSLAAVAQFWIWLALQRRRSRARVQLYETGTVEVGYDTNGPMLCLAGVIRSMERAVFVKSVELTLEKEKTRTEFRWMAFKPNFFLPLSGGKSWEMPGPFLVSPGDPHRFNIVFHDLQVFQEVKVLLHRYYQQWHDVEKQIHDRKARRSEAEAERIQEEIIGEFKRKEVCVSSYTELDRKCYWEQGAYALTLKVLTDGGTGDFSKHLRFNLSKIDSKLLKSNCIAMLEEPIQSSLGKTPIPYKTVQAEFAKVSGEVPATAPR